MPSAPSGPSGPPWPSARLPLALRVLAWRARPALLLLTLVGASALAAYAAAPPPGPSVAVVVAAADLRAGHVLERADVRTARLPPALAPDGASGSADGLVGEALAVDVPRGLPLVSTHLAGSRFARTPPAGTVAVPVRLADAAVTALLRPGDRIDLVAGALDGWADGGAPRVVAEAALVLEVRPGEPAGGGGLGLLPAGDTPEPLVLVAVPPEAGHRIAASEQGSLGAVLVRGS